MKLKTALYFVFLIMIIFVFESAPLLAQAPPNPGLSNTSEFKPEKPKPSQSDFFTAKDKSEAQSMCDDFARESAYSKCSPVRSYKAPGQWYCDCLK